MLAFLSIATQAMLGDTPSKKFIYLCSQIIFHKDGEMTPTASRFQHFPTFFSTTPRSIIGVTCTMRAPTATARMAAIYMLTSAVVIVDPMCCSGMSLLLNTFSSFNCCR
mgnify:CR=1 FL=1